MFFFKLIFLFIELTFSESTSTPQPSFKVIYESPTSVCYAANKAYQCTPPFTNIAESIPIVASSTCGMSGKPERICKSWNGPDGEKKSFCELCDVKNQSTSRSAERLTDRHIASNQTCWVSDKVEPGASVNLTLSLGKRFEVFYISLQPCGPLPDSIALYKSSDFGRTWKPWQYFSTDCYRAFGLPTSSEHSAQISSANIQEVLCVALKQPSKYNAQGQAENMIAFSTTIGRSASQPWSSALIDWMTMTDMQISLKRFPEKKGVEKFATSKPVTSKMTDQTVQVLQRRDRSYSYYPDKPITGPPVFRLGQAEQHPVYHPDSMQADGEGHSTQLSSTKVPNNQKLNEEVPTVHFTFSDIAVGGRCKCNGHANRCVRDRIVDKRGPEGTETIRWGPLRCDCQHNTVGADCERCSPGHLDRPWARATLEEANICKPCQCSHHTNSCMFDINLYRKSEGRTGGVCMGCGHNTEGVNCQECIAGFTRHFALPMHSPDACQACECNLHSYSCTFSQQLYLISKKVGGGVCEDCRHHTTGQKCQTCADGYYRDWTKPISHPRVCNKCQCHPIGSIGNRPCDRKSGQCSCKPGVTGQTCNRCLDGYKQTRSKITPCIKAVDTLFFKGAATRASTPVEMQTQHQKKSVIASSMGTNVNNECKPCDANRKRFKFKRFCRRQAVFRGTVISQEVRGELLRLSVIVHDVWRSTGIADRLLSPHKPRRNQASTVPVWVPLIKQYKAEATSDHQCMCPRLDLGRSYLFVSQSYEMPFHDRSELMLDQKSTILPWDETWRRRLSRFDTQQRKGKCETIDRSSVYGSRMQIGPAEAAVVIPDSDSNLDVSYRNGINSINHYPPPAWSQQKIYGNSLPANYYARTQRTVSRVMDYKPPSALPHMADEPMRAAQIQAYAPANNYQYRSMRTYSPKMTNPSTRSYYYSNHVKKL